MAAPHETVEARVPNRARHRRLVQHVRQQVERNGVRKRSVNFQGFNFAGEREFVGFEFRGRDADSS